MADKIVNVPGMGEVAFPDTMSDEEISGAIKRNLSLAPKGLAPVNPQGPIAPGTTARDVMGSASNVVGMGTAGAQLGGLAGPIGAAAGGLGGAALGAFLPPSDTPMTDLGATAGDLLGSLFLKGAPNSVRNLATKTRMGRAASEVIKTGLGAAIGATGDKALGFQKETPWGHVTIYSALSTPGAILGSLAAKQTPIAALADKHGIPLSVAERTGLFPGMERMLTQGSNTARSLGQEQTAAAQAALTKIIGSSPENSLGLVLNEGIAGQNAAKAALSDFEKKFVQAGTKTVTKQVPSGVGMRTVKQTIPGPSPKNIDFEKAFNLTPEEGWGFRQFINAAPDQVVEQLVPKGENQVKGLLNLRATMAVLDKSGYKAEAGNLGQAMVMRYLRETFAPGSPVNGAELAKRIEFALGDNSTISAGPFSMAANEPGHLLTALGPERAEALREVAQVLKDANPLEKVAGKGQSQGKEAGSYLFNKIAFASASVGAVSMAGGGSPDLGNLLIGAGAGAVVGIGVPTLVGMVMADPKVSKLLVRAAKGDTTAGARIFRTLTNSAASEMSRDKVDSERAAKSRLSGLFIKE